MDVVHDIMATNHFPNISDLDFSYFPDVLYAGKHGGHFQEGGNEFVVHFTQRNPADALTGQDKDKLLVASYAWDSNSFPGNEYWMGMLTASGDPAAACCSTIPELQNPYINPALQSASAIRVYPPKTE